MNFTNKCSGKFIYYMQYFLHVYRVFEFCNEKIQCILCNQLNPPKIKHIVALFLQKLIWCQLHKRA